MGQALCLSSWLTDRWGIGLLHYTYSLLLHKTPRMIGALVAAREF
jgi:hypothetical protein